MDLKIFPEETNQAMVSPWEGTAEIAGYVTLLGTVIEEELAAAKGNQTKISLELYKVIECQVQFHLLFIKFMDLGIPIIPSIDF